MNFNRPQIPLGVQQALGLLGTEANIDFEPTLALQSSVFDLEDSPYVRVAIPLKRSVDVAAVAAEFGVAVFRPQASKFLQVKQITIRNPTAGPLDFIMTGMTAANVTTAGLAVAARWFDMQTFTFVGSDILSGTHTTFLGSQVDQVRVPANDTLIYNLPNPGIILSGKPPEDVASTNMHLGIWCATANTAFSIGGYCREWPLGG